MSKEKLHTSNMNYTRKLFLSAGVIISFCLMTSTASYAQAANKAKPENPVNSMEVNPSTGLSGVSVISYFSNNMDINGSTVRIRMI
jgi:hypothetical protein